MIKALHVLIALLLCACQSVARNKSLGYEKLCHANDECYQVTGIDSINTYYIVAMGKNEHRYQFASKKSNQACKQRIKVGDHLPRLVLEELIVKECYLPKFETPSALAFVPDCILLDDALTRFCRNSGESNLYQTQNLDGLCYKLVK